MAIVRDALTNMVNNTGNSFTLSHTVADKPGRVLLVGFTHRTNDDVTGVTYGGVAMSQLIKVNNTTDGEWLYIYGLIAPATGANDIVASFSTSQVNYYGAVSYYNCKQDGLPNVTDSLSQETAQTSITATFTTTKDNCIGFAFSYGGGTETVGDGSAILNYLNGVGMLESNPLAIPTGEFSMTVNFASAEAAIIAVAVEPFPVFSGTETITMTDDSFITWLVTFTETITTSEPYVRFKKVWQNVAKNVASWLNQDKT